MSILGRYLRRITKKDIKEYIIIMIGTFLLASSFSLFFIPHEMVIGGVAGLGIIVLSFGEGLGLSIPVWLTNAALNIPLFVIGFVVLGAKNLIKTAFATTFYSVALYFTDMIPAVESDLFLAAVFGGIICGVGLGLVFRCMATTGGTDLAANILHKFIRHISIAKLLFFFDAIIIGLGLYMFGATKTMYAIISIYIATKVIDYVVEGTGRAKAMYIISSKPGEISDVILNDLERGVTALSARGLYTNEQKDVLMCVVSSKEVVKIKDIIYEIDPNAFVTVAEVREVLGEGFKSISGV
ncbi:MAG: YitT family protein [Defluviitaleaceae bacterium]|nr:YitT family protein [Defluviitaleaceae bacterium]